MQQGRRDVETVFTMGIMEDVNLIPQPAGGMLSMLCHSAEDNGSNALIAGQVGQSHVDLNSLFLDCKEKTIC